MQQKNRLLGDSVEKPSQSLLEDKVIQAISTQSYTRYFCAIVIK